MDFPGKLVIIIYLGAIICLDGILGAQVEVSNNEQSASPGENVTFLCRVTVPIQYCRIEIPRLTAYNLKPGISSDEIAYFGDGLDRGQCGFTIKNVSEKHSGIIKCVMGLPREPNEFTGEMRLVVGEACPALKSDDITKVTCFDNKDTEISCSKAKDGSYVKYHCALFYEVWDNRSIRYCLKGKWTLTPRKCVPVCGEKRVSAVPLIIRGQQVEFGNYPWITAVYIKDPDTGEFINSCGGSLLTQRVILTAAHCVTNQYGDAEPPGDFKIAVGKYFNKYRDSRDTAAQYSDIESVLVHSKYRGDIARYASDIAFLITKNKLVYSKFVQPVCYNGLNSMSIPTNNMGIVAGWGYTTAGGHPADELQEILVPYKDDDACRRDLPREWIDKFLSYDKFCAGYHNKSIAVCLGDSGSGLVFKGHNDRYYVHGIVSIAKLVRQGCDIEVSTLYTRVAVHYQWLQWIVLAFP